jgi:hypothetical protein
MARAWAERGFPVLRLDIGGIGDSPPFPGMIENDSYSARAVADIGEAAAALPEECKTSGRTLWALFRAHAAFHAALTHNGIAGIIMMNPIVFYWKPSDALEVSSWCQKRFKRFSGSPASKSRAGCCGADFLARHQLLNWIRSRNTTHAQV